MSPVILVGVVIEAVGIIFIVAAIDRVWMWIARRIGRVTEWMAKRLERKSWNG